MQTGDYSTRITTKLDHKILLGEGISVERVLREDCVNMMINEIRYGLVCHICGGELNTDDFRFKSDQLGLPGQEAPYIRFVASHKKCSDLCGHNELMLRYQELYKLPLNTYCRNRFDLRVEKNDSVRGFTLALDAIAPKNL